MPQCIDFSYYPDGITTPKITNSRNKIDKVHGRHWMPRECTHRPDWMGGTFDNDRRLFYGAFLFWLHNIELRIRIVTDFVFPCATAARSQKNGRSKMSSPLSFSSGLSPPIHVTVHANAFAGVAWSLLSLWLVAHSTNSNAKQKKNSKI